MGLFSSRKADAFDQYVYYLTEVADTMYLYDTDYQDGEKELEYKFRYEKRGTIDGNYMTFDTYHSYFIFECKDGRYESQGYKFAFPRQALVCLLLYMYVDRSYPSRYYRYLKDHGEL